LGLFRIGAGVQRADDDSDSGQNTDDAEFQNGKKRLHEQSFMAALPVSARASGLLIKESHREVNNS
jgi:hypothetical protein